MSRREVIHYRPHLLADERPIPRPRPQRQPERSVWSYLWPLIGPMLLVGLGAIMFWLGWMTR